MTRDIV